MKNFAPIRIEQPKRRTRAHMVLFATDTPFRPKRVENKKAYARRPKYVKLLDE